MVDRERRRPNMVENGANVTHDPNAEWRGQRCPCSVCSPTVEGPPARDPSTSASIMDAMRRGRGGYELLTATQGMRLLGLIP